MQTRLHPLMALGLVTLAVAITPPRAEAEEEVGADGCATCHSEAASAWKHGPHASAADRLSATQRKDLRCKTCHEPFGSDGLKGVQCENCHGSGTYYARDNVMRDQELSRLVGLQAPEKKVCAGCHADSPSIAPFHYEQAKLRIRHWAQPEAPAPVMAPAQAGHATSSSHSAAGTPARTQSRAPSHP